MNEVCKREFKAFDDEIERLEVNCGCEEYYRVGWKTALMKAQNKISNSINPSMSVPEIISIVKDTFFELLKE